MKKKTILVLLTLSLLCITLAPIPTIAHAETPGIIKPYYTLVASIHGTCQILDGEIEYAGTVNTAGRATKAKITVCIQKNDGSGWKDVKSFSETGVSKATVMGTYTPESNVFYRAKITGDVSNATDSESVTITTQVTGL